MVLIDRNDCTQLGYDQIDVDHEQFIVLLNQLDSADNTQFPLLFAQLVEHTEQHFALENRLMDQFAFPATAEHKGEHQRVLGEFKQFKKRIDKGLISFGRSFVRERLPQWFELHISTMDSALVAHMNKQQEKGGYSSLTLPTT